jgi:hypothetical protein
LLDRDTSYCLLALELKGFAWPWVEPGPPSFLYDLYHTYFLYFVKDFGKIGTGSIETQAKKKCTHTVLGALAGLYGAFVAGAPAFNWLATGVFVCFGTAWILLYRQAEA